MSGTSYLLVLSNPVEGKEKEYNDWYTNIHIGEVAAIDGIISAQRFQLTPKQMKEDQPHKYAAIYEVENGKEAQALDNLQAAMPNLNMQPVIDLDSANMMVVESISDRVT